MNASWAWDLAKDYNSRDDIRALHKSSHTDSGAKQIVRIRRPTFLKAVLAPLFMKLSFHFRNAALESGREPGPGRFATFTNALTTTKSCVTFSNGTTNQTPCWLAVSILPRRLWAELWRQHRSAFWIPLPRSSSNVGSEAARLGRKIAFKDWALHGRPTRSLSSHTESNVLVNGCLKSTDAYRH